MRFIVIITIVAVIINEWSLYAIYKLLSHFQFIRIFSFFVSIQLYAFLMSKWFHAYPFKLRLFKNTITSFPKLTAIVPRASWGAAEARPRVCCLAVVEEEEEAASANQRSADWCLLLCCTALANQRSAYWSWAATDTLFNRTQWHQNIGGSKWWIWGECVLKCWIWGEGDLNVRHMIW